MTTMRYQKRHLLMSFNALCTNIQVKLFAHFNDRFGD